jgi:hypothetical protein
MVSFGSVNENHRATYPKDDQKWTWCWSLRQVTNIFNQSLRYSYVYEGVSKTSCSGQQEAFCSSGCNDVAVYPDKILYSNGKYRIQFDRVSRTDYDTGWNSACSSVRFQRSLLDPIRVEHHNGSGWELVRKYKFTFVCQYRVRQMFLRNSVQ